MSDGINIASGVGQGAVAGAAFGPVGAGIGAALGLFQGIAGVSGRSKSNRRRRHARKVERQRAFNQTRDLQRGQGRLIGQQRAAAAAAGVKEVAAVTVDTLRQSFLAQERALFGVSDTSGFSPDYKARRRPTPALTTDTPRPMHLFLGGPSNA